MELYLQFGYGMMDHCRVLLSSWGGGTAILSPRDLTATQLRNLGADISKISQAQCLIDPQFYLPHADHKKLCEHSYWPKGYETTMFWQGPALSALLKALSQLNRDTGCTRMILPGLFASSVDDDWLETQRAILDEARSIETERDLIATIALSAEAVQDADQVSQLLENAERWKASAYYIVCEHPKGNYLVDDPNWLANVLDLAVGLRLLGADVTLGYCTHQMLVAVAAKVNAIASGTWMNVRSFPPEKFKAAYEDEIRQRATWYYCPQALSEYKIPFLDIAHRLGVLSLMASPPNLDGGYASSLFSGVQPSAVNFSEQSAFRHYLHALRAQAESAEQDSFDAVMQDCQNGLDAAESLLRRLRASNVSGQLRDFHDIVDVNRAALGLFAALRGPMLRRQWDAI
ncbi:MAG TPA: hypothetical protein VMI94_13865 [Bryobacteraceae bacterium]|nr:hypothetical protein [Bryobacteraceae bacterium]